MPAVTISCLRRPRTWILCLSLIPTCPTLAQFGSAPSFGTLTHKRVQLHRRLPPVVDVRGKTIGVVIGKTTVDAATTNELLTSIESLLSASDSGVKVGSGSADLIIQCQPVTYDRPKVTPVPGSKTNATTLSGDIGVTFRILDVRTSSVIKAGSADSTFSQSSELNAGNFSLTSGFHRASTSQPKLSSTSDVQTYILHDVARKVASYLVNTDEPLDVELAQNGSLNPPDQLAISNLWSRDLEQLSTMTPYPDPRADAYRIYNIGVAQEALAYEAQDKKAALRLLREASTSYGKALAQRSDEKGFLPAQERIKTALAHYSDSPASASPAIAVAETHPADAPVTDEDIISMVEAKMDQGNIIDTIQTAPKVNFDLSVSGQVKMTKFGVNGLILKAMKERMRTAQAH